MADTQITGTLSADESISGSLTANKGIDANLTPDKEVSGALEVKRTRSIPTNLDDLGDVNITSPQDGQVMKYNGLTDEWENANDEDSGVWGSITGTLSDQTDLQNALDEKIPSTEKGSNNGVATLDATGRVPSSQLPSFVDDVLEYASLSAFPATGEAGKIYVALDTNKMYRWSGSTYVEISESLALGETTGTAYEGSKGKANADNISAIQGKIPSNASSSNKLATASDIPVITGKADKVQNATSGHFAGLDANGNLTDSGVNAADIVGVPEELLKDTVGWTGKNLNSYPYYQTTRTQDNVTFTDNGDGTVLVNTGTGGASNFVQFVCHNRYNTENEELFIPNGRYILSGCPSDGSLLTYRLGAVITKNGTYQYLGYDIGNGVEITINGDDYSNDGAYLGIVIDIISGAIISNKVFKPMLRLASVNDATYEPYHKPVKQTLRDAEVIEGKNLISYPYPKISSTHNDITYTVMDDGSVKCNGTASAISYFNLTLSKNDTSDWYTLKAGAYTLSDGNSNSKISVELQLDNTSGTIYNTRSGEVSFTINTDRKYKIFLRVASGSALSNEMVYPMLRYATEEDATYEPYYIPLKDSKFDRSEQGILGAKNLIPYPYDNMVATTNRGITFKPQNDGSVTYSGTANNSGIAYCNLTVKNIFLKAGTYILSDGGNDYGGCCLYFYNASDPTQNYSGTYSGLRITSGGELYIQTTETGATYSSSNKYGYNKTFTIGSDAILSLQARSVNNTYTSAVSGTIYPMLRLATDSDSTYQPYAETNYQLTHNKLSYKDNGVLGAKNLLPYPYSQTTKTENNVTFTDNGDGTVTVTTGTGGATADTNFTIFSRTASDYKLPVGEYCENGCPSGGGSSKYFIWVNYTNSNNTGTGLLEDYGEGSKRFSITSGMISQYYRVGVGITIKSGTIISTPIVFKPMIRLASDPDDTWQPYAMTNKELTGKVGTLAPLASPALTGTPTAPTAASGTNTTQIATTAFVKTAIDTAITQVMSASY